MVSSVSQCGFAPSFGMAQLTDKGREIASLHTIPQNDYLNGTLFERPKFFSPAQISGELRGENASFSKICKEYGCSKNPKTNADFINNQVLSKKGQKAIKKGSIPEDELKIGLFSLLASNYDNSYLSKASCEKLLDMSKDLMATDVYTVFAGIFRDSK